MFVTYLTRGKFKSRLIFAWQNGPIVLQACAVELFKFHQLYFSRLPTSRVASLAI